MSKVGRRRVCSPWSSDTGITDGHEGKVDVLVVRSRAFQLIAEVPRIALDVVIGIYHSLISFISLMFTLILFMMLYREVRSERCSGFISFLCGHHRIVCISCAQQEI